LVFGAASFSSATAEDYYSLKYYICNSYACDNVQIVAKYLPTACRNPVPTTGGSSCHDEMAIEAERVVAVDATTLR